MKALVLYRMHDTHGNVRDTWAVEDVGKAASAAIAVRGLMVPIGDGMAKALGDLKPVDGMKLEDDKHE